MSDFEVQHQTDAMRFLVDYRGQQAELTYKLAGQTIDFDHTYVPFRLRGKGIAEVLVETGLAWAKAQGYDIKASCWYVEKSLVPQS
ncbi:GNAT family N-acetyltransferase [Maricurvus nonylphenolicus]|uniref:GNAT family N-acetyltransferase n=1 Tax=Maricurvus nonylphenolicus TaxID=1008307 RepID=UPI0036F21FD3